MNPNVAMTGSFPAAGAPAAGRRSSISIGLFVLFIVGVHVRLGIYNEGSLVVPMYLCVLAGAALCLFHGREMLARLLPVTVALMALLTVLVIIAVVFGANAEDVLRGNAQLIVSILLMGVLIISMHRQDPRQLSRLVFVLWCIFSGLAVVEIFFLGEAFSSIVNWLYAESGRGIYDGAQRDLFNYGVVRPRAFASEPSMLAFTLNALAALCLMLNTRSWREAWIKFAAMTVVGYFLSPSLTVVFSILAVLVWQFWPRTGVQAAHTILVMLIGIVGIVAVLSYTEVGAAVLRRIGGETVNSGSFFGRIVVGPLVAADALMIHPFFGYGVGNDSGVAPIIEQHWQAAGAFARFPWYMGLRPIDQQSNGFYWMWIELGIVGTLAFIYLICAFLRAAGVRYPLRAVVCGWIIWYSGGAFIDPVSWFAVTLFAVAPYPEQKNGPASRAPAHQRITPRRRSLRARAIGASSNPT